jgi:hypothetical protein
MRKILLLAIVIFGLLSLSSTDLIVRGAPFNLSKSTPQIANLFYQWHVTEAEAKQLAKWDILIIDMEAQHYSPDSLKLIRQYNPNIKLLAYLSSQEVRGDSEQLHGTLRKIFYRQM